MKYRKLDADGDFTMGTGADFHLDSPEGVVQAVLTRLLLFTGEWFLDTEDGTPWNTEVLGKYTTSTYDAVIKSRILGTLGVVSIDAYESRLDRETRTLSITATITTAYGQAALAASLAL